MMSDINVLVGIIRIIGRKSFVIFLFELSAIHFRHYRIVLLSLRYARRVIGISGAIWIAWFCA